MQPKEKFNYQFSTSSVSGIDESLLCAVKDFAPTQPSQPFPSCTRLQATQRAKQQGGFLYEIKKARRTQQTKPLPSTLKRPPPFNHAYGAIESLVLLDHVRKKNRDLKDQIAIPNKDEDGDFCLETIDAPSLASFLPQRCEFQGDKHEKKPAGACS